MISKRKELNKNHVRLDGHHNDYHMCFDMKR